MKLIQIKKKGIPVPPMHPFETYLMVTNVNEIEPGLYRYLPLDHSLLFIRAGPNSLETVTEACQGQAFCAESVVLFMWTAIPYRTEWRYHIISHKMITINAGHLCQNLYLACGSIGAGTCGIGAYDHQKVDTLLGVDGENEFAVYLAPVGRVWPFGQVPKLHRCQRSQGR